MIYRQKQECFFRARFFDYSFFCCYSGLRNQYLSRPMLDPATIQLIAQSYSTQELFAALVWQRQFNAFNGEEVIRDLSKHSDLWVSFLFTKPIFTSDPDGLSFGGLVKTLLAMANYRPMPPESILHYVPYPADTLYILTPNQDTIVSQLMDLGKKWKADSVETMDSSNPDFGWRLKHKLKKASPDQLEESDLDAIIISYWWD